MIQPIPVVIVSYNTADLLLACLASLQECRLPLRIIVVDNGSRDESVFRVRAAFPHIEVIATGENLGFARANNLGFASLGWPQQGADYGLVLNPDTVVQPGAIEALVDFLQAHPRVGMVGPRLLNPDRTRQTAAFRFPTLAMIALDLFPPGEVLPGRLYNSWWHGRYPQEHGDQPFPIDHPLGACMLVRRETALEVGLFDPRFFMYSEEVEWCWRIKQAAWAIWQVPHAEVVHVGGAATSQFRQRMLVALYASRAMLARDQYGPWRLRAYRAIVIVGMLRASLLAWRDYWRRQIDRAELRERLWAYGNIIQRHGRRF